MVALLLWPARPWLCSNCLSVDTFHHWMTHWTSTYQSLSSRILSQKKESQSGADIVCLHVYLLCMFLFASVISVHLCSRCELNRADTYMYISKESKLHHSIGSLIDGAHPGPKTDRDDLGHYCPNMYMYILCGPPIILYPCGVLTFAWHRPKHRAKDLPIHYCV